MAHLSGVRDVSEKSLPCSDTSEMVQVIWSEAEAGDRRFPSVCAKLQDDALGAEQQRGLRNRRAAMIQPATTNQATPSESLAHSYWKYDP